MKICMYSVGPVFNNATGGRKRFAELACALKKAGHDVFIYSLDDTSLIRIKGFKGEQLRSISNDNERMPAFKAINSNKNIIKQIKHDSFDRIVVFDVQGCLSLAINGVRNICLFIRQDLFSYKKIQYEDASYSKLKENLMLFITKCAEGICLRKASKIIVQCKYDLDQLIGRHRLMRKAIKKKSYIQINNANPSWIISEGEESLALSKYDVCFIGNFENYRKGYDMFLKAVSELILNGHNLKVVVIGDGAHLDDAKETYRNFESIYFLGKLANPIPMLRESLLLVVPSYADSCPNTVLEALYHCIPVIGSNRGGIPEILPDPSWTFDLNINDMKQAIIYSLENRELLKNKQNIRRDQLLFDWGEKMTKIIIGDNSEN